MQVERSQIIYAIIFSSVALASSVVFAEEWHDRIGWPRPQKKLIEIGWDLFTLEGPANVRANIRKYEQRPFDGIIFWGLYRPATGQSPHKYSDAFTHERKWTEEEIQPQLEDLAHIEWDRFTDNFFLVNAGERAAGKETKEPMDWYNDEHWENILHNIKLLTKAVVIGRCKGICFDPETYHRYCWNYNPDLKWPGALHRGTKSYEEYCAQLRKRGAQYMEAIQSVMPNIRILNLYQSVRIGASGRSKNINSMYHGFINGMLDAAGPQVVFIDGNEKAYSYMSQADFDRGYVNISQRLLSLVAPENRAKYKAQVQVGSAIYVDHVFGLGNILQWIGTYLTPRQRAMLYEHNLYYALDTADEYVWIYSERLDWWRDQMPAPPTDQRTSPLPHGAIEAMISAKEKVKEWGVDRRELGFSMAALVDGWKVRYAAIQEAGIPLRTQMSRSASIRKRSAGDPTLSIDGVLDDPAWQRIKPLEGFVPLLSEKKEKPEASTEAKVTWDDKHLYVALTCREPAMDQLKSTGRHRDGPVAEGDSIELLLRPDIESPRWYRLVLNPKNVQWDGALEAGQVDLTWDARCHSAVVIGNDRWTAELAVPWIAIGGTPPEGGSRRANLARHRTVGSSERSTWTPLTGLFKDESIFFGTWTFEETE